MTSRLEGALVRRGLLGVRLAPLPAPVGTIAAIGQGTPAQSAGLAPGDRITAVDGASVGDNASLRLRLASLVSTRVVRLGLERSEGPRELEVIPAPRPLEEHDGCDVIYTDFLCGEDRLRAIVTVPLDTEAGSDLPFLLFVAGHGGASIDAAADSSRPISALAAEMARAGTAFVRFDRSGIGDSEGPAQSELSFAEECDQVAAAWRFASDLPCVSSKRGALFAHSLGFSPACHVACSAPPNAPAGLIVYGGGLKLWTEYSDESCRRQWALAGVSLVEQERALRALSRFFALLLVERLSLPEVLVRMPEILDQPALFGVESDSVIRGRPYRYWQDLYEFPIAERIRAAALPVLAAWGTHDYLSSRLDHELIAQCADEARPGLGTFAQIPDCDHGFADRASLLEAFRATDPGRLHDLVPEALTQWFHRVLGAAEGGDALSAAHRKV